MEKEEQSKEENIKKFHCPECGATQLIDARFCSKCGAYLVVGREKGESNLSTSGQQTEKEKKFSRKKKMLLAAGIIGAVLLFLGSGIFWLFSSNQKKLSEEYQNKVNGVWEDIYEKTPPLKEVFLKTQSVEDFSSFKAPISDLQKTLNEKNFEIGEIIPSSRYKDSFQNLKDFISVFSDYLLKLNEVVSNPLTSGSQDTLLELQDKATQCQKKLKNFEEKSGFIKKTLPQEIFDTAGIREIILKFQEDEEAKKKEETRKKEEEESKKIVSGFMNELPSAYNQTNPFNFAKKIAKKYWHLSALGAFENYYSVYFDDSNIYYKGGRIISVEKLGEGKYSVICEEYTQSPVNIDVGEGGFQTKLTYFIVEKFKEVFYISGHGNR